MNEQVKLNNMKTLVETIDGFNIYFEALEEHITLKDSLEGMEPDDMKETIENIENGKYVHFCANVSAEKGGVHLGNTYLGSCIYESEEAFYTTYHDDYFIGMAQEAVEEAKKTIVLINK